MKHQVLLLGSTEAFTENFARVLDDCGFETVFGKKDGTLLNGPGFFIFEAIGKEDLKRLSGKANVAPFLIYDSSDIPKDALKPLRDKGLMGVITGSTTPEDISFLVNKALFYDKMLKRNPRVPVSLQVVLRAGVKVVNTNVSLLSRDGMFIVTLSPLPPNSVCRLRFELPGRVMETEAKVLYNISINKDLNIIADPKDPFKRLVSHPGMAVFFLDLTEEDRQRIDDYIGSL